MTEVLNLKRLFILISRHWFENRKAYLLFFLSIGVFLLGWFSFLLLVVRKLSLFDESGQATIYFFGLFLAGCLSASFLFQDFSGKPRTSNYLLLPASAFEKLLCVLFYGIIIFFLGYSLMFYIADFAAIKMAKNIYTFDWQRKHGYVNFYHTFKSINTFSLNPDMFVFYPGDNIDFYTAFFPIQSSFILGAVYFKKNGFIKTLVALLSIWLIFLILESRILFQSLPAETKTANAFTAYLIPDVYGYDRLVTLPEWVYHLVLFVARFCITPVLWVATYFRLKEKEL